MWGALTATVARRLRRLLDAGNRRVDPGPWSRVSMALLGVAGVIALAAAAWLAQLEMVATGPQPAYRNYPCNVIEPGAWPAGASVAAAALISPAVLRPGDRFRQELRLTNPDRKPVTVHAVSMETYQEGALLRSTPDWFNATRHKAIFRPEPVPGGAQECLLYRGRGEYSRDTGCGEMKARFTFRTSAGDFVAYTAWRGVCE